jgi:uncharacterized protein
MKFANPAPLGLAGFALTTWLLSMINIGWFDSTAMPMVLASAFAFGGAAQFCAGLLEYPRGNTFGFVAFCGYGAFWWTFALFVEFLGGTVPVVFVGWFLMLWGVFTFFMWFATFRANRILQSIFLSLWITFLLLALGEWFSATALHVAGGYFGLLTAALAFYLAAADVINETRGKVVLPIGPYRAP